MPTLSALSFSSGYFTVTESLEPGTYQRRIKGALTQANTGSATLVTGLTLPK